MAQRPAPSYCGPIQKNPARTREQSGYVSDVLYSSEHRPVAGCCAWVVRGGEHGSAVISVELERSDKSRR
jgi:hypothetical protein